MPEGRSEVSNSQTLVVDAEEFSFKTIEQQNGMATVLKFKLENPRIGPGDVLLVLSGTDILFHGFIGGIVDGWATAIDRQDSHLAAAIH